MSNAYYGKYFSLEVVLTLLIRNVFSPDSSFLETHKKKKMKNNFQDWVVSPPVKICALLRQ